MAAQRSAILKQVRARAAAARARNRADLQPLLQTAALYETKGQGSEARALYDDILAVDKGWGEALHRYFWFLDDQGDAARVRGSLSDAERDYGQAHSLAQRLVASDASNTQWQRDLSISHERIGDVLVALGDGPGALAAYRKGLEIAEAMAALDPANVQWQTDVAVSCAKLGTLQMEQIAGERRHYLLRGRRILIALKSRGRLMPNQDWIGWFDARLAELPPDHPR